MAAEILMLTVENRKLQCIDHTADCVNDSASEKPSEFCTCQIVEDLTECEDTDPSHTNVEDGGYPFRAEYPEPFDNNSGDCDTPYKCKHDKSGSAFQYQQADWCVASGDQYEDHHMVDLFQDRVDTFGKIKGMVGCACGV